MIAHDPDWNYWAGLVGQADRDVLEGKPAFQGLSLIHIYLRVNVISHGESGGLENGFRVRPAFYRAEVVIRILQIPQVLSRQDRDRKLFAGGVWRSGRDSN